MNTQPAPILELNVVSVTQELKEQDLENVSAGLDKVGPFASLGLKGMSFPNLSGS